MNDCKYALEIMNQELSNKFISPEITYAFVTCIETLEKQIPKKVYHFLEDDTFETTCCGYDVTNQDFNYCPNCGQSLGKIEEVEGEDE